MNQNFLHHWLWSSWTKKTAYKQVQEKWNKYNRDTGQCAVTALLVQDILWWKIKKSQIENYWLSHYWNNIKGEDIDFTKNQFSWEEPIYKNIKWVNREKILSHQDTYDRYTLLKQNFNNFVEDFNKIEKNIQKSCTCDEEIHTLSSSIYFGKNCNLLFVWEAPAKDGWRVTWKAWINQKWNIIPSGKILQKLLDTLDINLFDITFTEAVKCFPKERKDLKKMVHIWEKTLLNQIRVLSPNTIITLWDFPTKALLWNSYKKFSDVVWKEFYIEIDNKKYLIIPTYHPSPISPQSLKGNIPIYEKINQILNY